MTYVPLGEEYVPLIPYIISSQSNWRPSSYLEVWRLRYGESDTRANLAPFTYRSNLYFFPHSSRILPTSLLISLLVSVLFRLPIIARYVSFAALMNLLSPRTRSGA